MSIVHMTLFFLSVSSVSFFPMWSTLIVNAETCPNFAHMHTHAIDYLSVSSFVDVCIVLTFMLHLTRVINHPSDTMHQFN